MIGKVIEGGIVKRVKWGKKIVEGKECVIWEMVEDVMKGDGVLVKGGGRVEGLGMEGLEGKMMEGKGMELDGLGCRGLKGELDGEEMGVELGLSKEGVVEGEMLMVEWENILKGGNGGGMSVGGEDMVVGLYYITKVRKGGKGEGLSL